METTGEEISEALSMMEQQVMPDVSPRYVS